MKTSHYETSIKRWLSICTIQFFVFIKCRKSTFGIKIETRNHLYIIDTHLSSSASDLKILSTLLTNTSEDFDEPTLEANLFELSQKLASISDEEILPAGN